VVAEQVVERAVLAQGDALSTGVVVPGDDAVGDFVVVADEVSGDVVDGLGDALALLNRLMVSKAETISLSRYKN